MKVVILPGVGFHNSAAEYEKFAADISLKVPNCETVVHCWQHTWPLPNITLPYKAIRQWLYEVILDFQQVIKYANQTPVPKADYYIGHSAGSILALVQDCNAAITFGSPAILADVVHTDNNEEIPTNIASSIAHKKVVLNIINKYDQLAYYLPFNNVENYVYNTSWWIPKTYNPYIAHQDYWKNEKIIEKITDTLIYFDELFKE